VVQRSHIITIFPQHEPMRVKVIGPEILNQGHDNWTSRVRINGPHPVGYTILRIKQKRRNYGVPKGDCRTFVSDSCQTASGRFPSHDRRGSWLGQENRQPVRTHVKVGFIFPVL